jgi:hypothetical protein
MSPFGISQSRRVIDRARGRDPPGSSPFFLGRVGPKLRSSTRRTPPDQQTTLRLATEAEQPIGTKLFQGWASPLVYVGA